MIGESEVDFWRLPAGIDAVEAWLANVQNRRSLLVLAPSGHGTRRIAEVLRAGLAKRDFYCRSIDLASADEGAKPLAVLTEAMGYDGPPVRPRGFEWLDRCSDVPDVVLVSGCEAAPIGADRGWLEAISAWAGMSKAAADAECIAPPLVLVAPASWAEQELPSSETHLVVRSMWGGIAALDVQMLCRLAGGVSGVNLEQRWRESVLPSLVGDDLVLLEHLWDAVLWEVDEVVAALLEFGARLNLDAGDVTSLREGVIRRGGSGQSSGDTYLPAPALKRLWARGVVSMSPEYGLQVHPGAAILAGDEDGVRHRLWRGQVSLMLPFLDEVRVAICAHLTRQLDRRWPFRGSAPRWPEEAAALEESPLSCEYGRIEYILSTDRELHLQRRRLQDLVREARSARNLLAHYQPLAFKSYQRIHGEVRRASLDVSS